MVRRARFRSAWLLGVIGAAVGAACKSSTSPHVPTPCPTYSGGLSTGDSLFGLYHLVSYCLDTLPAYGPPVDTGHVTLTRFAPADSFVAVIATAGQLPESILGTYTHPLPDSIHVTGVVKVSGFPVSVEVPGRFMLQQNTLSVSGRLVVTGTNPHLLSFIGARSGP